MARCRCAETTCNCSVTAGMGVHVTGTGAPLSPYIVSTNIDSDAPAAVGDVLTRQPDGSYAPGPPAPEGPAGPSGPPGAGVPTGVILDFGGTVAPTGFLLCDGASHLRTSFPDLFTVIGVMYGSVDATHFNVPDFRGRGSMGYDPAQTEFNLVGKTGGEKAHTQTTAEVGPHTHAHALTHPHTHVGASHTHPMPHTHAPGTAGAQFLYIKPFAGALGFPAGGNDLPFSTSTGQPSTPNTGTNSSSSTGGASTNTVGGTITSTPAAAAMPVLDPYVVITKIIKT